MTSPNNRFKRLLGKQIKLYNLDEFRTPKLNYKTVKKKYVKIYIYRIYTLEYLKCSFFLNII